MSVQTSYGHRWNEVRLCVVDKGNALIISETELMQSLKEANIPASRPYIKAYIDGGCLTRPFPGQYQFTTEPVMNGILTNIIEECNARLCHPQKRQEEVPVLTWQESVDAIVDNVSLKEVLIHLKEKYGVQSRIPITTYDEI